MKVGDKISAPNASWSFGGETSENFYEHIKKSVPFYAKGHNLIVDLSDYFVKENSLIYELGCSSGELSHALASHNEAIKPNAHFYGIDIEKAMVDHASKNYNLPNLHYAQADILEYEMQMSDLIISYYTIQFIRPSVRQLLINKIYNSLNWGGAFIYFEKVRANDARFQDIMTGLYDEYKIDQGYSFDEIVAKRRSLKGILEPFSTQGNVDLLKRAGFVDIISIFKYVSFEGFLAIK